MSSELWRKAQGIFPGGVNSPVRAAVKPFPFYVKRGKGAYLYTEEGNRVIDYVLGYGPLILGHSPEGVRERIIEQIQRGWLFGTPTRVEVELARKILSHVPSGQMIRFVNSGTEATMLSLRLARGFTKRDKVLKFDGNYHGAHDYLLFDAGSAASEFGIPNSEGIPSVVRSTVEVCEYNDVQCVEKKLKTEQFAATIVEPVMGNMGVILPNRDFLTGLREVCEETGTVLIFDEVITGFRLGLSGAQGVFKVLPDLTVLGKIIGGGMPIGGLTGKREIMELLTPAGKVFNAGTFNAHPLSMVAGLATIEELERGRAYETAERAIRTIVQEIEDSIKLQHTVNYISSMMQVFFGVREVRRASDARASNKGIYSRFHESLLKRGVFIPPSQFETIFTSASHDETVVESTLEAIKGALREIQ
jgi:glutamate-1-semialdehyde 2,1-aminomutase